MGFQVVIRSGHPDLLDLPWALPLGEWDSPRLVDLDKGISRHVVRFVDYDGRLYALKQLPRWLAEREWRLLRELEDSSMPVVAAAGLAVHRAAAPGDFLGGSEGDGVLITRHLEHSLPYRTLFTAHSIQNLRERLLDALAQLLVRLHIAGFFWGDCSLSNALFRRDAGALVAYLVDAETGELHPQLSDGQRRHDLDIAEGNLAGELMDVEAEVGLPFDVDPVDVAAEVPDRYAYLWGELTREEIFASDERYRIEARLRRLNDHGFDVEEYELIETERGFKLRLPTQVVELGHHRRRLHMLTGLDVQENQARRLLNDLCGLRAHLEHAHGRPVPEEVAAYRWRSEVFEPAIAAIPEPLRDGSDTAELFHEVLEHRWFRSEEAGRDIGIMDAVDSYVTEILRPRHEGERAGVAPRPQPRSPGPGGPLPNPGVSGHERGE
jgi:hypothetical protein